MTPRQITDPAQGSAVLALLHTAFAGMQGRIDPPSSLWGMTGPQLFAAGEIWAIGAPPLACVILRPHGGVLQLGKLAVAPDQQGKGHARALIDMAVQRARTLGLPCLELQTRIELIENHAVFHALGFQETARRSHPGYDRPTTITFCKSV